MPGILDGIRIFDLSIAAVGPWAAKLLGELGADVIKVEAPGGELSHYIPPPIKGSAVLYISANFNKRHIVLDLKQEADRAIALKIVKQSDVFIQNMRPGAVERLGLGYDVVSQLNPRLIYVSASAYGRTGPMAKEAGVDPTVQAFSGWCSVTGQPGSQGEMFRHFAHLDINTSSMIVEAVLQALLAREKTGRGQNIEIEMVSAALSLQTSRLAEYFATRQQPQPMGSAVTTTVPHQAFRCEDQQYIAVGGGQRGPVAAFLPGDQGRGTDRRSAFCHQSQAGRASPRADSPARRAVSDQAGRLVGDSADQGGGAEQSRPGL